MTPPAFDTFSRQIVETMPVMFREFVKREDNVLTRGKISFPQMVALDYVSKKSHVKMTELAGMLHIKTSSATVLVDRLIRQGMLGRSRDEKDRRLVWVRVTPKGKKVLSQIMEQKRKSIRRIFSVLTEEERSRYLSMLLKVRSYLEKGNAVRP